jgi:hypothetical protein
VKTAKRETAAEVWLRPPSELRMFLKRWWKAAPKLVGAPEGELAEWDESEEEEVFERAEA